MKDTLLNIFKNLPGKNKTLKKLNIFYFSFLVLFLLTQNQVFAASAIWNYDTQTGTTGTKYSWINCTTGTQLSFSNTDDGNASINWPFSFSFYGDTYTTSNSLSVGTNGFIRLNGAASTDANTASGYDLASASTNLGQIIAFGVYDNKIGDGEGWTRYVVSGSSPYRILTIEFNNVEVDWNDGRYADFQVSFYETTNVIVLKLGEDNLKNISGIDMGIHSGVSGFFNKWQEVYSGTNNTWIEYTPASNLIVTATGGILTAKYYALGDAINKINNGTHTGAISIEMTGSTNETGSVALNESGNGSASYSSLSLYPSSSGLNISGAINGPLLSLNGSDNVIFDGRVNKAGSSTDLTIRNTNTGTSSVTIQISNSAQNNTVKYCSVQGGGGASTNGTIILGTTGTDTGNKIDYCNITNNGTRRANSIYATAGTNNSISNCNIYDDWSGSTNSFSINLSGSTSDFTISNNSIYQTASFTQGAYSYYGIYISNTNGNNFNVTGNYFGGKSPLCGGTAFTMSTANSIFYPIYLNVGSANPSSVQGNTINNIAYTSSNATPFSGIHIVSGSVNVGNITKNIIGNLTGIGNVTITSSNTSAVSYGINNLSANTINISNNEIGAVTAASSSGTNAHSFRAISNTGNGTCNILSNVIGGSTVTGSIRCQSASTGNVQYLSGIYSSSTGTINISGNTIFNLLNNTTRNDAGSYSHGIRCSGAATNTLSNNFINDIDCNSSGISNIVAGIYSDSYGGTLKAINNIIYLGRNLDSKVFPIYGISNAGGSAENYLHNTIYISGSAGTSSVNTSAFNKVGYTTSLVVKNNVFVNLRTGGTTAKHASITFNATGIACDNNNFYASGIIGVLAGTAYSSIGSWQIATSADQNSINFDPVFASAGGTTASGYYPGVDLVGENIIATVPNDFGGTVRSTYPTMGAWERPISYNVEVYNGATYLNHYNSLNTAFNAINKGTHTGILTIKLIGSTIEKNQAVLNQSGTSYDGGTSDYSTVKIYPTVSGVMITGNINSNLILLNGADNVIIDGRINESGSTADLQIKNSNALENSVTIGINNSAQNNTIKYCMISGGGGSATNGTINFGVTGINSGNKFDYCDITNNGTRRLNGIYSLTGTNIDNIISNNNIYDIWSTGASSYFINLGTGSSGFDITGNSFYESALFNPNNGYSYYGVNIDNSSGSGFVVSNNYFGGQTTQCGGSAMNIAPTANYMGLVLYPFYFNIGTASTSSIQGNTIKNLNYSSYNLDNPFYGYFINSGNVNVGTVTGNVIGDETTTGSVVLTGNAYSVTSYGFYIASGGDVQITNNKIGSLTTSNTNTANSHSFYGIHKSSSSGLFTVSGNTIGSTVVNSIQTSSVSTNAPQAIYGIYTAGTGSTSISGNSVLNLYNNTTNNNPGSLINGIYYNAAGTNSIEKNYIFNLKINSTGSSNILSGIYLNAGSSTITNNIISIGGNNTGYNSIYGIYETGVSSHSNLFYHNTVYLSGSVGGTASLAKTYCFYKANNSGISDLRNNIFFNARSSGNTSSRHYAIRLPAITNVTIDFNDYFVNGTYGYVGSFSGTDKQTFANWKSSTLQDESSFNIHPLFFNIGGSLATDYKANELTIIGIDGLVSSDFGGNLRFSEPLLGAWESTSGSNNVSLYVGDTYMQSYRSLRSAFNGINNGIYTGNIKLEINLSTNETSSAVLNASGIGSANYSSILLYPTGPDISIIGNINGPLVKLNGADKVKINGSVYQTNGFASLTFLNNSTGSNASTINFIESAQDNKISYCNLKGVGAGSNRGVVYFSTASSDTGNDRDTIVNCNISGTGPASSTRPLNAIYSEGSTGFENSENVIASNSIFDFFNQATTSYGVNVGSYSTAFKIIGNSFYETTSFVPTSEASYSVININNTTSGGYLISDNYIGGNSPLCSGTWVKSGNDNVFNAINLNVGNSVRSSVQGNIIKNFNYSNTLNATWTGINLANGGVDIGTVAGNTLGESSGIGSLTITNSTSSGEFYGIYLASTSDVDCYNNILGSINVGNTGSKYSSNFYGIYKTSGAGITNIFNNTVGSLSTENSLISSSLSTDSVQTVIGIYSAGTDSTTINGNSVSNLVNATTGTVVSPTRGIMTIDGSNTIQNNDVHHISTLNAQSNNYNNATLIGIMQISETPGTIQTITGNNVNNMTNLSLETIEVYGIFYKGPATGTVETHQISRNFIHTLNIISTDAAYFHGISLHTGTYTASNNVVFLGNNITTGCKIWGIWNNSNSPINISYNTSYLSGQAATGTSNSFAFRDLSSAPTDRTIMNNILWNGRTNTSAISHYAIFLAQTANTTINYNDYQFAQDFGLIGTTPYATIDAWRTATLFDDNSFILDPQLTNLGGVLASDYQPSVVLPGTPIAGITTDYGFIERSTTEPTIGAWEFIPNPVEIWNSTTFRQSYMTLKGAFDAINLGTWTGNLVIKIRANTNETATAALYQSGYTGSGGLSSYSKVVIYPVRNSIQVKGTLAAPLVELNGADNVTFDGRKDSTGSVAELMLINESTSNTSSTLRFVNSAESNTIKYCYIKGLNTNTNGGLIAFSTATSGNGNDNNLIANNNITINENGVGARVINAIYSLGSDSFENSGNIITGNSIFDIWSKGANSYGINISSSSTDFTISGNSFYETTAFVPTSDNTYQAIRVDNASGNNFIITGNYIGGRAAFCLGSPMNLGSTTRSLTFQPIYLNTGTSTASSIQGNYIKNIQFASSSATAFAAITVVGGNANIGTISGNYIGEASGSGSILLTGSATEALSGGVYVTGSGNVSIANNYIGSITTATTSGNGYGFYGIYKVATSGSLTVSNNIIGSTTSSGSINLSSTSTGNNQMLYGIYTQGTGDNTIGGNTIANLVNGTTRSNSNNSLAAIYFSATGAGTNLLNRNFIYNLSISNTTASALNLISGIYLFSGTVTVFNNIILLGSNVAGNYGIYGIYDLGVSGQTNYIYHNTVYLNGTPSTTTSFSATYYRVGSAGVANVRNNIFSNARSGGGTNKHYVIYIPGSTNLTINYNNHILGTTGFLGRHNTTNITSFNTWKSTANEPNSENKNPLFSGAGTSLATGYRVGTDLLGVGLTSVTSDYGQNTRNGTTPTKGAWERVNKWKGSLSIDWNTAANWTDNTIPATDDNIIFDDVPSRPCFLDQNRSVTNIVNGQSSYKMVTNGFALTIKGDLNFTNGAQIDATATGSVLEFAGSGVQTIPTGSLYNNKVYNLKINNSNNVILYGTVSLMNNLVITNGLLNATMSGSTVEYSGTTEQTIEIGQYYNNSTNNMVIANTEGVILKTNFTVNNDLSITSGSSFALFPAVELTVNGVLTNSAGNQGLLIGSSATGTASLIHNSSGVAATVQRYINGTAANWHFLSSPLSGQSILGTDWTPAGGYGDGTGYDLYIYDEPTSCWIYNLNTTVSPTWPSKHPQNNFVPGRGYLYAALDTTPTKLFIGTLNNGTITQSLTMMSDSLPLKGFNFLGNPYPSSIDWTISSGFSRSMLHVSTGGYDIWTWSSTANNYGVYNSADGDGSGTNNVTKYIAPMQGFFVYASSAGNFAFNNNARVHTGASDWLKSATPGSVSSVKLTVNSVEDIGSDEVKIRFGNLNNGNGALKLFSHVKTAPSLYITSGNKDLTIHNLTTAEENPKSAVSFKAGKDGNYTLSCQYDESITTTIYLEDKLTGKIHDFNTSETYNFSAMVGDSPDRFVLHYGSITPTASKIFADVFVSSGNLIVDLSKLSGEYSLQIYDISGIIICNESIRGGEQFSYSLKNRGIYIVTIRSSTSKSDFKVRY